MKIVGVNDDGGGGDDDDDEEIPNMGVNEDEIRTNFLFVSLPDWNWKNQELMFFFLPCNGQSLHPGGAGR